MLNNVANYCSMHKSVNKVNHLFKYLSLINAQFYTHFFTIYLLKFIKIKIY